MLKPFLVLLIFFSLSLAFLVGDAQRRPPPPAPIFRRLPPPPPRLPQPLPRSLPPPPPPRPPKVDIFIFSQQWPPGQCYERVDCDRQNNFTIEGLWPYKYSTEPIFIRFNILTDCIGSIFELNSVSEFEEDLDLAWPSLRGGVTNEELWEGEWNTYGRCSEGVMDQTTYFQTALVLKNQFDLLRILARSGIVPDGRRYRLHRITEAIRQGVNVRPLLACRSSWDIPSSSPIYVLSGIYLCVDKYGQSFVQCPPQRFGLCGIYSSLVRFDQPFMHQNSVLISSNATTTSAAIGIQ